MGTPGFAAPEQFRRSQTDNRSDIYSFGATIHYLLTLKDPACNPFNFEPVSLTNLDVSPLMEKVISSCTEIDPEKRFKSAEDVTRVLKGEISYESVFREKSKIVEPIEKVETELSPSSLLTKFSNLSTATLSAILLLVPILLFALWYYLQENVIPGTYAITKGTSLAVFVSILVMSTLLAVILPKKNLNYTSFTIYLVFFLVLYFCNLALLPTMNNFEIKEQISLMDNFIFLLCFAIISLSVVFRINLSFPVSQRNENKVVIYLSFFIFFIVSYSFGYFDVKNPIISSNSPIFLTIIFLFCTFFFILFVYCTTYPDLKLIDIERAKDKNTKVIYLCMLIGNPYLLWCLIQLGRYSVTPDIKQSLHELYFFQFGIMDYVLYLPSELYGIHPILAVLFVLISSVLIVKYLYNHIDKRIELRAIIGFFALLFIFNIEGQFFRIAFDKNEYFKELFTGIKYIHEKAYNKADPFFLKAINVSARSSFRQNDKPIDLSSDHRNISLRKLQFMRMQTELYRFIREDVPCFRGGRNYMLNPPKLIEFELLSGICSYNRNYFSNLLISNPKYLVRDQDYYYPVSELYLVTPKGPINIEDVYTFLGALEFYKVYYERMRYCQPGYITYQSRNNKNYCIYKSAYDYLIHSKNKKASKYLLDEISAANQAMEKLPPKRTLENLDLLKQLAFHYLERDDFALALPYLVRLNKYNCLSQVEIQYVMNKFSKLALSKEQMDRIYRLIRSRTEKRFFKCTR
jgi:hypothetical protein